MVRALLASLAVLALAACEQMPQMKDPPPKYGGAAPASAPAGQSAQGATAPSAGHFGAYRAAIVKDLVIDDNALGYMRADDRPQVEGAKAALIEEFSAKFREEIAKRRYFGVLASEGTLPNAVVVEPRALVLDPGAKTGVLTGTPTRIDVKVSITDAATGAPVASYIVPLQFLPHTSLPVTERLRRYFPAATAKVAERMASVR